MNAEPNSFTKFEHESWERVASKYEDAWSGLTSLFIGSLLDAVRISPGQRLLDVACGPGYVARAAAQRGAVATGLDFSAAMVRLAQEANPSLEFRQGDAQALPFADNNFERVVMNFGLLHLAQPDVALRESFRVLRPGGRFACTVWAPPEVSAGATLVDSVVSKYADRSVQLPQGPDYFTYANRDSALKVLEQAGFKPDTFNFETKVFNWRVPTATFVFDSELNAGVRTAALLKAQAPEVLQSIKTELEKSIQSFAKDDHFELPYGAHVISIER